MDPVDMDPQIDNQDKPECHDIFIMGLLFFAEIRVSK